MKIEAGPALARAEPVPMMRPASSNVLRRHRLTIEVVQGTLTANSASESDHADLACLEPSMKAGVVCGHKATIRRQHRRYLGGIAMLFGPGCGISIQIRCASEGGHVEKTRFAHEQTERTG